MLAETGELPRTFPGDFDATPGSRMQRRANCQIESARGVFRREIHVDVVALGIVHVDLFDPAAGRRGDVIRHLRCVELLQKFGQPIGGESKMLEAELTLVRRRCRSLAPSARPGDPPRTSRLPQMRKAVARLLACPSHRGRSHASLPDATSYIDVIERLERHRIS